MYRKFTPLILAVAILAGCSERTAEEHVTAAKGFIEQRDLSSAILELKNAAQKQPASAEVRYLLGMAYLDAQQYESAEKEFNKALEFGYEPAEVLPYLSEAYQNTGAYLALSKLDHERSDLTAADQAKMGYYKLISLTNLEDIEGAILLARSLKTLRTDSVYRKLIDVYTLFLDEKVPEASELAEQVREEFPMQPELIKLQGQLYLMQSETDKAIEAYEEYVRLSPLDVQGRFLLASVLVKTQHLKEAERHVDNLLEINAQHPLLNQYKAVIRTAAEDYKKGLEHAETAIRVGRNDPTLRLLAGFAAYQLGNYGTASRHLSYIGEILPANHPGLRLLAASQLQLGQNAEAGEVLNRIEDISKEDAALFSKASYELLRSGNLKQAETLVKKSQEISGSSAEDLARLGILKLSLQDIQGLVDLESAAEKGPELKNVRTTLATAYLSSGQYDKALQLAEKWKQSEPDSPESYLLAGGVYLKQQKFQLARGEFEQSLQKDPEFIAAEMALINMEFAEGKQEQGLQELAAFIKKHPTYVPALATYYYQYKTVGQGEKGVQPTIEALKLKPDDLKVRLLAARIFTSERHFADVIQVLKDIEADSNTPLPYWQLMGQALLRVNNARAANKHFDAWLAFSPYNKDAVLGKLMLHDYGREFEQGIALADSFLTQGADIHAELMRVYFLAMARQYDEARASYYKLPNQAFDLPFTKGILARLQIADSKVEDALENAYAAYSVIPNNRNLMLYLFCLESLERREESLQALQAHIERFPNDLAALMLLAERQINIDVNQAIVSYQKVLDLAPDNFVVLNNLGYLYLQQGNLAQAKEYVNLSLQQQPKNPAVLDTLAQILLREGKFDEAIRQYEQLDLDKIPSEEIYLNYVEALHDADQTRKAQRKLKQRSYQQAQSKSRAQALQEKFGG